MLNGELLSADLRMYIKWLLTDFKLLPIKKSDICADFLVNQQHLVTFQCVFFELKVPRSLARVMIWRVLLVWLVERLFGDDLIITRFCRN